MWLHADFYILLAGFIITALGTVAGLTWKLSRVEFSLRETIQVARDEVELRQDEQVRNIGETIRGFQDHVRTVDQRLTDKIREVELFCRDTFVRRDGFYKVRDEMSADLKALGDKIETRLERMEVKIDSKA